MVLLFLFGRYDTHTNDNKNIAFYFLITNRMPYKIICRKNRSVPFYEVKNKETGRVSAKHTTKAKGEAQIRLLNAIEHGWKPKKNHGFNMFQCWMNR